MTWKFVNTGFRIGRFNMAYDEYLAHRLLEGKGMPTVRVFGWEPFAISLGYHQREEEIDRRRCEADGIDVVRRPTGGRAILHAHELTYSVTMFAEGRSVMDVYEHISNALVAALRRLGVDAEMSQRSTNVSEVLTRDTACSCFANISRYEVQYKGKKMIGSAQRRYTSSYGCVVLQHGSLLLGPQHRLLSEYIANTGAREVVKHLLEQKTSAVETVLGREVSFEEAAEAVRWGFEDAWGVRFIDGDREGRHGDPTEVNLREYADRYERRISYPRDTLSHYKAVGLSMTVGRSLP